MSQRYSENIKRPKPQDTQLGILKIYAFCWKIQQRASGPGKSTAGIMWSVFENTPKKLVVQGRMQLEQVGVEATCLHFNP